MIGLVSIVEIVQQSLAASLLLPFQLEKWISNAESLDGRDAHAACGPS
jgi:hypothetical protein